MQKITKRLASLIYLLQPLTFALLGILLISLGVACLLIWAYRTTTVPHTFYYLTLQFLPLEKRGLALVVLGLYVLGIGIWKLSGVVVYQLHGQQVPGQEVMLDYKPAGGPPQVTVLSGGFGLLMLAGLGEHVKRLTCITPVQDPVEYYYRASSLFSSQNVYYVVPTPTASKVYAELDDGTRLNVMHIDHHQTLAERHVDQLALLTVQEADLKEQELEHTPDLTIFTKRDLPLTRLAREALETADVLILGPGSLFESVLPNLLIEELRTTIQKSKARKIYICNLMTEPGRTTGFSVSEHLRQIKRYGGFTPDYVLVNVQRIDPEVRQIYAVAHQAPIDLSPEEYEETAVLAGERVSQRQIVIEGSIVVETNLSSSVVQYSGSMDNPGQSQAAQVLRHDPQKLTAAILELLRRET